jgi:hypothetical protein
LWENGNGCGGRERGERNRRERDLEKDKIKKERLEKDVGIGLRRRRVGEWEGRESLIIWTIMVSL